MKPIKIHPIIPPRSAERLSKMVELMEKISANSRLRKNFDLGTWGHADIGYAKTRDPDKFAESYKKLVNGNIEQAAVVAGDCGFAACACGWAGFDTWFRRRGFKTIPNMRHTRDYSDFNIYYRGAVGTHAAADFLTFRLR